jgi:predicted RNase H-like nuclease
LAERKKTFAGAEARIALLARVYGRDAVMALVRSAPARMAATDDILDALAALWTAGRISAGTACSLPSPIVPDATGLPAAIFY